MSFGQCSRVVIGITAALALLMSASAHAQSASSADKWTFSLTPYLWLPNINGTLRYSVPPGSGNSPEVGIDAKGLLESLDFAMMITGEARKGRWGAFTDVIYLDLSAGKSAVKGIDFNLAGPLNPLSTSIDAGTSSTVKG